MSVMANSPGVNLSNASSTSRGVSPGASRMRLATRNMWVSTAIVGSPKIVFSTTFAVLRPTPGSFSSASRSAAGRPRIRRHCRRRRDHVLRFAFPQADRADVLRQAVDAELRDGVWSTGDRKQLARGRVDALVRGLRRQDDRHQQLKWRLVFELGRGMWVRRRNRSKISRRLAAFMGSVAVRRVFCRRGSRLAQPRDAPRVRCGLRSARARRSRAAARARAAGSRAAGSSGCSPPDRAPRRVRSRCTARR